mmetsp:Transcript_19135/g.29605  ORF Transcript_19135/g.29605 Transcript_19135/m.29605 type:complete len:85 (+) Transcript_19135:274-528(+)
MCQDGVKKGYTFSGKADDLQPFLHLLETCTNELGFPKPYSSSRPVLSTNFALVVSTLCLLLTFVLMSLLCALGLMLVMSMLFVS